ncbi:MAG: DUF362 domain-containing protein [Promethearchaeota archaeon]
MCPEKKETSKNQIKKSMATSLFLFSLINLLWLTIRTGAKPSRITYPCQRAAAHNLSISLSALVPISITAVCTITFKKTKIFLSNNKKVISSISVLLLIGSGLLGHGLLRGELSGSRAINQNQEIQLSLESKNATIFPSSTIYAVNGQPAAHINELINLMGFHGLFFYKPSVVGVNQCPEGLIGCNDVVLIKINSQWNERGGTNTDILKELIQTIVDHPDGFIGEIVVVDNGQGWGSLNWDLNNAENHNQSTQDVVDIFSTYNVSTYDWQTIRSTRVDEYIDGDMMSGYILYDTADPETGIRVSYPKFVTKFGTFISFKHGIWNGTGYEKRLKVINMPILKSHFRYGVTASCKNYMGVQSEGKAIPGGLANGHECVRTGGMGTLMVESGLPTLNIIDAIWVNANPYPSSSTGPPTKYNQATRVDVLVAGTDPVALDYWAAKYILVPTAKAINFTDTHTIDPENTKRSGLEEAFGVYLNKTKDEIMRSQYDVTTNENRMNVYVSSESTTLTDSTSVTNLSSTTSSSSLSSTSTTTIDTNFSTSAERTPGIEVICTILGLAVITFLFLRRRRKK